MNIAVAVSGGADSLYALLALREQGHEVTALHARFLPPGPRSETSGETFAAPPDPVPDLARLCGRLGVPLRVVDLIADFERHVIVPFVREHVRARTPNPCARCNRAMKFGLLLDEALAPSDGTGGADAMATGHYADLARHPRYGLALRAGRDPGKDQSYFLALVPAERLRHCVFPLAEARKADIRDWLIRRNFEPPLPGESQEICFVPHDDHRAFLERRAGSGPRALPGPGPVLLDDPAGILPPGHGGGRSRSFPDGLPVIGEHQGLWRYTEGQRRGLGIAWTEPLFVLRRDRTRNALIVGPAARLEECGLTCSADQVNFLIPPALWPSRLLARVRYRQAPAPVEVEREEDPDGPILRLRFAAPQLPPAPGQVAVISDEDGFVLAGGVLREN